MKTNLSKFFKLLTDIPSVLKALKVALFVGTILLLINNPQLFHFEKNAEIHSNRILLTYIVPFCVSLYSSVTTKK